MANLATDARKSFQLSLAKLETSIRFAWDEMWTDLIKLTWSWTFASQNTIIISMVLKLRNCSLQMLMVMGKHRFVEQLCWFWNHRPNNWNYWSVLFLCRHPVNAGTLAGDIFLNTALLGLVEIPSGIVCFIAMKSRFLGRKKTIAFPSFLGGIACITCVPVILLVNGEDFYQSTKQPNSFFWLVKLLW